MCVVAMLLEALRARERAGVTVTRVEAGEGGNSFRRRLPGR